jgi:hypothetical protein
MSAGFMRVYKRCWGIYRGRAVPRADDWRIPIVAVQKGAWALDLEPVFEADQIANIGRG